MTLEISEIGIRLAVGEPAAPASGVHVADRRGGAPAPATLSPQQIEDLTQACVREVLRTLRMLGER